MENKVEKYDISKPYFRYDWLHGTVNGCNSISEFLKGLFNLDKDKFDPIHFVKMEKGLYNYTSRLGLFGTGIIQICWIQDEAVVDGYQAISEGNNSGIFFIISGDGIRYLGVDLFIKVCFYLHSLKFKCSRLDVACDLFDPANPFVPLYLSALDNLYTENYASGEPVVTSFGAKLNRFTAYDKVRKQWIINYWIGRKASEFGMLRIYDKYFECYEKHPDLADELVERCPQQYWYRFEFELHKTNANVSFLNIINGCTCPSLMFCHFIEHYRVALGNNFQACGSHPVFLDFLVYLQAYSDKSMILYN